jgi:hypothetical protein
MTLTTYDVEQGSDEWLALRTGIITASEMHLILTPTLKPANNDKTRQHVWEIAAQRINAYTEPSYIGDAMLRGHADEIIARDLYSEYIEPVQEVGFYIRDIGGVHVGYSPDGAFALSNGGIEIKSRVQKYQLETIVTNQVPIEHRLQLQAGLFVTGWDYIDYVSFSGGMPMWAISTKPDPEYQDAIHTAVMDFEDKVKETIAAYHDRINAAPVLIDTERQNHDMEMIIT